MRRIDAGKDRVLDFDTFFECGESGKAGLVLSQFSWTFFDQDYTKQCCCSIYSNHVTASFKYHNHSK